MSEVYLVNKKKKKKSYLLERNTPLLETAIHNVDKNVIDILSIFWQILFIWVFYSSSA